MGTTLALNPRMRPYYLLFFSFSLPLMAQAPFTFGVKGGVPAQTPLGGTVDRMPFVLGPTVDFRISSRLSIESGVLFHRLGTQATNGAYFIPANSLTFVYSTETARALEIPLLAKFRILADRHAWRPFITLGPTIRRTSFKGSYSASILSGAQLGVIDVQPAIGFNGSKWNVDPVVGAGVDVKAGRFHLEPEARYSYWRAGQTLPVRKNQVDFLLGFRF